MNDGAGNRPKSLQLAERDAVQKRAAAVTMQADDPVKTMGDVRDVPRSSFSHRAGKSDGPEVRTALLDVAGRYPTYGDRRLPALPRRAGRAINHKRIRRVTVEMGLQLQRPVERRKARTANSRHDFPRHPNRVGGLKIGRPAQGWGADITSIRPARDFGYPAVIPDGHPPAGHGRHLSRSPDREPTPTALRRASAGRGPNIHHSDRGV
ncbi:MAG: hypothetical protein ACUVUA_18375 [Chloroflexus sp.]|uniref:hypothetical protein n=1 Tax=Chloroflexus sp. TaxID=1904827 RepID=UPI0040492B37